MENKKHLEWLEILLWIILYNKKRDRENILKWKVNPSETEQKKYGEKSVEWIYIWYIWIGFSWGKKIYVKYQNFNE